MPKPSRLVLFAILLTIPLFLFAPRILKWGKQVYVNVLVSAPGRVADTPDYALLLPDDSQQAEANNFRLAVSRFLRRKAYITTPSQETDLEGSEGWFYSAAELHMALIDPAAYNPAASEIIQFHKDLGERNIRLLFLSLPCKWEIYPEGIPNLPKGASPFNVQRIAFLKQLSDAGVWCVDLGSQLLDHRKKHPDSQLYFKGDHHWTPLAAGVAASLVAPQINQELPSTISQTEPANAKIREISFTLPTKIGTTETAPARVFPAFDGHTQRYPTVLLGDSFSFPEGQSVRTQNPQMIGFPPQLAFSAGRGIETITMAGGHGAAKIARREFVRRATQEKGYLAEKELVIWEVNPEVFLHWGSNFPRIELPPARAQVETVEQTSQPTQEIEIIAVPEIDIEKLGPYTEAIAAVLGKREGGEAALYYIQVIEDRKLLPVSEKLRINERFRVRVAPLLSPGSVQQGPSNAYLFEPDPFDPSLKQYWIEEKF